FLASHSTAQLDPPPLISGNDVIARGIPPGPRIRTLLESIRNAQLDQLITTREEALQLLQQQIAR
ncbi:MAG: CCA tRNA nucleotidyltransferase, partial [Planctomyces sp.]